MQILDKALLDSKVEKDRTSPLKIAISVPINFLWKWLLTEKTSLTNKKGFGQKTLV